MFKKNFKEFDFRGFVDFILELVDRYGLGEIRFSPEHKENFSEVQLTHIAPGRSINNPNGFVWAWKRCQGIVRRVSFDQFSNDRTKEITMTIDLGEKSISLDRGEGVSSIEVEEVLKRNIKDIVETKNISRKVYQRWWMKYLIFPLIVFTIGLIIQNIFFPISNLSKPFIYLVDGTGEYSQDTLNLEFVISNSGSIPARIINIQSKASGFPVSVNKNELILSPGEEKRLTGTSFTDKGISNYYFTFQFKIEYFSTTDEKEENKYCIEYIIVKKPDVEQIGISNSEICE